MTECIVLNPKLFGCLPMDVIREHIMPYAYSPKPLSFIQDIRSFHTDWNLLKNFYIGQYNYIILANDIVACCEELIERDNIEFIHTSRWRELLTNRFLFNKNKNGQLTQRHNLMWEFIMRSPQKRTKRRNIWFLFGLMTPEERTYFINKHVLIDIE